MTTLIGLFEDQKKAEKAINALSAADLDDVEFETIYRWDEDQEKKILATPAFAGYGSSGSSGVAVAVSRVSSWNLEDEEEQFFKRTVQEGGVLIVVDVDDEDQMPQVKRILRENGEKVATGS